MHYWVSYPRKYSAVDVLSLLSLSFPICFSVCICLPLSISLSLCLLRASDWWNYCRFLVETVSLSESHARRFGMEI